MRKIVFGTPLFIAIIAAGCGSSQLHQSLLLHEHRQLEDALYAAHAQIADLQRENDVLRKQQGNEYNEPPGHRAGSWDDDLNAMPPFEMPTVIIPGESGTSDVPESLRGSQAFPSWSPRR